MAAEPTCGLIVAEPAGRYSPRPPLVVDCSVLAAVLFGESERDAAALTLSGKELFAPDLLDHELANVAVKKAGRVADALIEQALAAFEELHLTRYRVNLAEQWRLARRFDLSAYDAAYLLVAAELQAPLATFDQRLGAAARRFLAH